MPRSAARNAAEYPPGPAPKTSISQSLSGDPGLRAACAAGVAAGRAVAGVAACAGWEAGVVWLLAAPSSRTRISAPCETLSPTLSFTALRVPAAGEGTSMVALSDSKLTRGSSLATTSPGFTSTSITGTSVKSPMSGTLTSITLLIRQPLLVFARSMSRTRRQRTVVPWKRLVAARFNRFARRPAQQAGGCLATSRTERRSAVHSQRHPPHIAEQLHEVGGKARGGGPIDDAVIIGQR